MGLVAHIYQGKGWKHNSEQLGNRKHFTHLTEWWRALQWLPVLESSLV